MYIRQFIQWGNCFSNCKAKNVARAFLYLSIASLFACGGGGGGSVTQEREPAPISTGEQVEMQILALYDFVPHDPNQGGLNYSLIEQRPIRGANIFVLDSSDRVITSGQLSDAGIFTAQVPANAQVSVQIEARLQKTQGASRWNVEVVDNTNNEALYLLDTGLAQTESVDFSQQIVANSGWGGGGYNQPRAAAPFAIADAIYSSMRFIEAVDSNINLPPLTVNWSTENIAASGDTNIGEIGTSFFRVSTSGRNEIFLLGRENFDTEEYDPSVIVHEYGHYLEENIFTTNSVGGSHGFADYLDMRLAFGEGFGNAFSGMVLGINIYQDAFGNLQSIPSRFSLEEPVLRQNDLDRGWYSEQAIHAALYDIFDSQQDTGDTLSVGFAPIYNALASPIYTSGDALSSIFKFSDVYIQVNPADQDALTSLLHSRGINSTNQFAIGETDNALIDTNLPIYKPMTEGDAAQRICTSNLLGEFNSVENRQFIRLTINSAGTKEIRVASGGRPSGSLELGNTLLYRNNVIIDFHEYQLTQAVDSTSIFLSQVGDYVIEYFEDANIDEGDMFGGSFSTGGLRCVDISVRDI